MKYKPNTYINTTEISQLNGVPIYLEDITDACLRGKLNLFLQGDTGSGKTQLAKDMMQYFGNKAMFILGRNDMDTRELFQQIKLGRLAMSKPAYAPEPLVDPISGNVQWHYLQMTETGVIIPKPITEDQAMRVRKTLEGIYSSTSQLKELTDKINYNLIVVDELPNCVSAVRAQLFNLFDGFIELDGKTYPIGSDYCVGIATGNLGQEFTESSNELGRALKDRMHVIVDVDHYFPKPIDLLEILSRDRNPRVSFISGLEAIANDFHAKHKALSEKGIPFEKYLIVNYLMYALDHSEAGSKRKMKSGWTSKIEGHEAGSDAALVKAISPRAAKSILTLSQALDEISTEKGAQSQDHFESMMLAFKLASAHSGIMNPALVNANFDGDNYKAIDSVIQATKGQFEQKKDDIAAAFTMLQEGNAKKKVLDRFSGRWEFMKDLIEGMSKK